MWIKSFDNQHASNLSPVRVLQIWVQSAFYKFVQSAFYKFESSPRFTSPVQSAFYNMPERIVSALTAGEWTRAQASYRFDDGKALLP